MADIVCHKCPRPADCVQISLNSILFSCNKHSFKPSVPRTHPRGFSLSIRLQRNPDLANLFWPLYRAIPAAILSELLRIWGGSEDICRFRVIAQPEDLISLHDRDRILRFVMAAGVKIPSPYVDEDRAENILIQMMRGRASISVISSFFSKWPVGKDKFKVLTVIIKSKYAPFEKKLLMEMLLPYYVELALNENTNQSKAVIERLQDKKLKAYAYSYVRYLESLYVLKATEINVITQRLPRNIRRYIVETFVL